MQAALCALCWPRRVPRAKDLNTRYVTCVCVCVRVCVRVCARARVRESARERGGEATICHRAARTQTNSTVAELQGAPPRELPRPVRAAVKPPCLQNICKQRLLLTMKRSRVPSTSEESDNGSNCTSWSQMSNSHHKRRDGMRPSEVFRTDLITAMKLHDSYQLNPEDYYVLSDPWRQEWEKGVQVPVSPESIPKPRVCVVAEKSSALLFSRPKKLIRSWGPEASVLGYVGIGTLSEGTCRYDLNEEDVAWLDLANQEFSQMGMQQLDENTMEQLMEEFERHCYDNMNHAMETEEGLGIEYDEDVVCDVCQSPEGEDGNEMVFCDKCNICVHQACYGILKVPEGSWLCRTCALGISPKCQLCPKKGGAMKPTRSGSKWVHVSCALWIPEVSIGNPEKMEPITSVSQIPNNRWALICCMCKEKTGACIQCSAKSCRVAFHVTCGLQHGLKMKTILTEDDEVKFKSYCPTHSGMDWHDQGSGKNERIGGRAKGTEGTRLSERKLRVQQLEDEFYRFVNPDDVAKHLRLPLENVDFLFQYWKLKRKANFNQPLVTPKREEEESLARREQEVLLRRLRLFTHLRQDLERVRNLTYMVTRREKIKRSVCRVQEQIFHHHVRLLEQGRFSGISSTRQLEEAMFYFRAAPSASTSLQPLRGHVGHNITTEFSQRKVPRHGASRRGQVEGDASGRMSKVNAAFLSKLSCLEETHMAACGGNETSENEAELQLGERRRRRRNMLWEHPIDKNAKAIDEMSLMDRNVVMAANGKKPETKSPVLVYNGSPRRTNSSQLQGKITPEKMATVKNWGSFRIPKRSDSKGAEGELQAAGRDFTHADPVRSLDVSQTPSSSPVRTRLRTGTDTCDLVSETDHIQSDQKKRCHTQRLRSHDPVTQRYGSEVLRRGVLAS